MLSRPFQGLNYESREPKVELQQRTCLARENEMGTGSSSRNRLRVSRREFLGATAAGAALALLNPSAAVARRGKGLSLLADYVGRLCYNENPLGPSPLGLAALTDSINLAHRYPEWTAETLKNDLATLHGVPSAQVVPGCGATEVLRLCALAFADLNGNVVCPYPSYSQFPADASLVGATVRYSFLDAGHGVDLANMASQVNSQTSAICITNPNNPTGTVLTAGDIADFIDSLPSHVVTIIDEAYHEYVHDPSYQTAIDQVLLGKKVVVVRTFSKAYGLAGARIGYAVGSAAETAAMSSWCLYASVSRPGFDAARAALGDTQHIADTVALNDQAKQFCYDHFDQMDLEYIPSETNFIMVDVGPSAFPVSQELSARGVEVRTGWSMPNHLRVSTGTMDEMQTFIHELADILGMGGIGENSTPRMTALGGNYPNPFNRRTQVWCSIARGGRVRLEIFNIQGRRVRTLVDDHRAPGHYVFDWDGRDERGVAVAPGSYFCRLTVGDFSQTRRMILVR
jgi:histidinol-phosphate aminotransferase